MTILTDPALMAAADGATATRAFWAVVAAGVELVAVIRVIRLPAPAWGYGRWSKLAAVVVAGWLTVTVGTIAVPVGAAAVIWHTRTLARRMAQVPDAPDLPMAEGAADAGDGDR